MDSLRHLDLIFGNNAVIEKAIQLVTINRNRRLIITRLITMRSQSNCFEVVVVVFVVVVFVFVVVVVLNVDVVAQLF